MRFQTSVFKFLRRDVQLSAYKEPYTVKPLRHSPSRVFVENSAQSEGGSVLIWTKMIRD